MLGDIALDNRLLRLAALICLMSCASVGLARSPLVLLTDFGTQDGAVSAMKGVAYGVSPDLLVSDLSHENPSIFSGAYRLYQTEQFWPTGTVFVAVVVGPAAVVVGFIGRGRVRRGIANNGGVAIAGIALGALAIIVGVAFIPIYTVVWKDVGGGDYIDCIQKANNDRLQEQRCADQFRQNVQDKLSVTLTPTAGP